MYHAPAAPQRIGGVLDHGFALFRESFRDAFLLAFGGALLSAPLNRMTQSIVADGPGLGGVAAVVLATLGVVVVSSVSLGAIVAVMHGVMHSAPRSLTESIGIGVRRFPPLFAGALIYFLAITIGLFLLIVPGVFLGVALLFFYIAVIADNRGPIASLQDSWELVRGNWWRTAALLTIITIVVTILYLLLAIVIGVVAVMNAGGVPEDIQQMPWYVDFVVTPLMTGLIAPLGYALVMSIYHDLKLRREGGDIAERIAAAEA